ncbi:MAG: hypothetical protein JSS81_24335 [Acidobacteria bacterium]|nr:hypothetical protein [Acidobacteriota bacterium]MBS1796977.1 hypothetical protein [Acidobacteriota bacterium]
MRVIKRVDRKQIAKSVPEGVDELKKADAQAATATTVKSWIVELRQKRENERRAIKSLFGKEAEYCG